MEEKKVQKTEEPSAGLFTGLNLNKAEVVKSVTDYIQSQPGKSGEVKVLSANPKSQRGNGHEETPAHSPFQGQKLFSPEGS